MNPLCLHWNTRSAACAARLSLGVLCLLSSSALAVQNDSPVTLRMKFKQGDTTKYQMNLQMTMSMMQNGQASQAMTIPMNMNMTLQQQVVKVLPNGGGEVTTTVLSQQSMMNGQQVSSPPSVPPTTITYDAFGKVLSMRGLPKNSPMSGMMGGNMGPNAMTGLGLYLPARPVRPGDTWTQTVRIPMMGGSAGTVQSKLMKYETIGHFQTARIRSLITMPIHMMVGINGQPTQQASKSMMSMSGTMKGTFDNNFAIAEGKTVRQAGNMTGTINMKPHKSPNMPNQPGMGHMPTSMQMNMKMSISMDMVQ